MKNKIQINDHTIGKNAPCYIVAEMSANHLQNFDRAIEIVHAAKKAGADAIKLQTYTPDTITIDCNNPIFKATGELWEGTNLYKLYQDAYTPWEWQPKIMEEAEKIGLDCFSSPFDPTAVDFMEEMNMPAYKIASYEITDIPLIRKIAKLGKPVIFATGVATISDIDLALKTCLDCGNENVVLLKCVSAYPTPYEEINLNTIPTLKNKYGCILGLSDHSFGSTVPIAATALGAKMVEKHLTLRRADGGPDSGFSMEPEEFAEMVTSIRNAENALGSSEYKLTDFQKKERKRARSLFVVKNIKKGETFTLENIRSIRPGNGLPPVMLDEILGKRAAHDLAFGKPLEIGDII